MDPWVRKIPWMMKWQSTRVKEQKQKQKHPPSVSSLLRQYQAKYHILSNNINNCTSNLSLLLNRVPLTSDSVVCSHWLVSHTLHQIPSLSLCSVMSNSVTPQTVHGIFQARILEWVAIFFSRGSCQHRDRTCVSCIGKQILYHCAPWEAHLELIPAMVM